MTAYPFTPSDAEERIKESIKPVEFKFSDFGTGFMDENLPAIAIDYLMNHHILQGLVLMLIQLQPIFFELLLIHRLLFLGMNH